MKRLIVFVALTAIVAFAATGTANARSAAKAPAGPTLAQFKALSKKVTTLQKQVKTLTLGVNAAFAYDVCLTAATADAFQGTWVWVNKGATVFPSTSTGSGAINDLQACSAFRIPRQLPSTDTAPSTAVFSALTSLFGP